MNLWNRRWEITCIVAVVLLVFSTLWIHDVLLSLTWKTRTFYETLTEVAKFTVFIEFPAGILLGLVLWFLINAIKNGNPNVNMYKVCMLNVSFLQIIFQKSFLLNLNTPYS